MANTSFNRAKQIITDYYNGFINSDTQYGTFKTTDKNGTMYQPDNYKGEKLKSSKQTVKDVLGSGVQGKSGALLDDQTVWKTDDGNYYVWDGSQNKYLELGKDPSKVMIYNGALATKSPYQSQKTNNNTTSGYTTPSYTAPTSSYQNKLIQNQQDRIAELEEMVKEYTRVWSADEVAAHLGLTDQYNEANILKNMQDQVNDYYDDATLAQANIRDDIVRNNAAYLGSITDAYVDSNKNVAPTSIGRATQAANLLSTNLGAATDNSTNDYGMYQNIQNLEASRKAELENTYNDAKQAYTNLGVQLSNWSATKNTSDIQQYVDTIKAYGEKYAADRSLEAYYAQANAAKYAGLTGYAQNLAYNNATISNSNYGKLQYLYNLYSKQTNPDYAYNIMGNQLMSQINNGGS